MSTFNAFTILGIVALIITGLALACWFAGKKGPSLPLFLHLLNLEQRFSRTDTRLMLHDLRYKMEAAILRVDRLEQELQQIRDAIHGLTVNKPAPEEQVSVKNKTAAIFALYDKGYGAEHIARKLKMGRGEVELFLALPKPPQPYREGQSRRHAGRAKTYEAAAQQNAEP